MRHFKKLIETIRTGEFLNNSDLSPAPLGARDVFFENMESIESIVIHKKLIEPYESILITEDLMRSKTQEAQGLALTDSLDMPFDSIAFEVMDGHFQIDNLEDITDDDGVDLDKAGMAFRALSTGESGSMGAINLTNRRHILCHVATPRALFWLVRFKEGHYIATVAPSLGCAGFLTMKYLTEIVNQHRVGVEHVRQRVKVGTGKTKRTETIRRVIHVTPKGPKYERSLDGNIRLDYSHRFVRRGHWRTLPGGENSIGKNRAGDYCVPGRTWVLDSVIGDESLPIVRKTRVFLPNINK